MTRSFRASLLLAGCAAFAMMSAPASAAPVTQGLNVHAVASSFATPHVLQIRDRRWRRGRHGNRFRGARRGFSHYYGGYYYAVPWWEDDYDDDGGDDDYDRDAGRGGGGGDHEDWCSRKYKSYKERTDTWTDYDGNTRRCISPYS